MAELIQFLNLFDLEDEIRQAVVLETSVTSYYIRSPKIGTEEIGVPRLKGYLLNTVEK